jgi:DNA invertase Pin-like site-specific DNA recombinase
VQQWLSFLSEIHARKIDLCTINIFCKRCITEVWGMFAEFERATIQERVRAGLRRARSEKKRLGRPRLDPPKLEARIRKALAAPGRPGVREIAKQFGIAPGTVQRISRPFEGSIA